MKARPYPAWLSGLFIFSVATLTFTGFLQMPLARRYALTEVPGLAWTGDFFVVHKLHYILACLLLFVVGLAVVNWLRTWRGKLTLTRLGAVRVAVIGGLVVSGGLRVYRNLPGVTLDPAYIVTIEWVHLILVMVLGVAALAALLMKSSAYAKHR